MIPDFSRKYTQANFIARRLIANFYADINLLLKNLDIENARELACGPGFSTEYLVKMRPDLLWSASDIEAELVAQTKNRNPQVSVSQESIYRINSPDNNFDLVIALEVLEHLEKPTEALTELKRVTKKYCLISVPREPLWRMLNMSRGRYLSDWGNTPGHINHWSINKFEKLVSPYFKIIAKKQPLPWTILLLEKNP
ncbi:MAG: hypothetical protein C3F02_01285 [Parcubacteria group bacterium]|nr:MAG: hypothetical protein C3F02_01285 [Parcubacteria group bacterium]